MKTKKEIEDFMKEIEITWDKERREIALSALEWVIRGLKNG